MKISQNVLFVCVCVTSVTIFRKCCTKVASRVLASLLFMQRMLFLLFNALCCLLFPTALSVTFSNDLLSAAVNSLPRPFSSKYFPSTDGYVRVARPVSWTLCSSPGALFHLESLDLSPDPPQRSSPLTVHVRGLLKERIESGWLNLSASFGGLQLVKRTEDGCSLLAKEGGSLPQCPIEAGEIDVTHTVQLPWHVPPGRYLIDVNVETKDDHREVLCLKLDVAIDLIRQE